MQGILYQVGKVDFLEVVAKMDVRKFVFQNILWDTKWLRHDPFKDSLIRILIML